MEGEARAGGNGFAPSERVQRIRTEHDDVPADGPWLFVMSRAAWNGGSTGGAWMRPDTEPVRAAVILERAHGAVVEADELLVVDQVGLDAMADEDHFRAETGR